MNTSLNNVVLVEQIMEELTNKKWGEFCVFNEECNLILLVKKTLQTKQNRINIKKGNGFKRDDVAPHRGLSNSSSVSNLMRTPNGVVATPQWDKPNRNDPVENYISNKNDSRNLILVPSRQTTYSNRDNNQKFYLFK